MPIQTDASIGIKKETVYGTAVTVDRFVEFDNESLTWKPKYIQGDGLRVGRTLPRQDRRVMVSSIAEGDFELEVLTRGLGLLFEAALGSVTTTKLTTDPAWPDVYQHLFVPTTADFLPSYTIQKALPLIGGARQAHTFLGAQCSGFELSISNEGFLMLKPSWSAREVKTDVTVAVPSYPSGAAPFSFVGGTIKNGATAPTTTDLASGGTILATIRDWSMKYDNALDGGGMNLGAFGKRARAQAIGKRSLSGKMTAEYSNNTLRDAWLAGTNLGLTLTFKAGIALDAASTIFATIEVHIPTVAIEGGALPTADGKDVNTTSIDWTGLAPATGQPISVVYRVEDATP